MPYAVLDSLKKLKKKKKSWYHMQFLIVLQKAMVLKSYFRILKRIRVGGSEAAMIWIHQKNTRCVLTESQKGKLLKEGMGRDRERERGYYGYRVVF